MNLFENILTPKAKLAFSQTGQAIGNAFQPVANIGNQVIQQNKQAIQPAVQKVAQASSQMVEPVMKPIRKQQNITKVNSFLQEKGITIDHIKALAEMDGTNPDEAVKVLQDMGISVQGMTPIQQQAITTQPVQETSITDSFKMKSSENFGVMEGIKDIGKFFVNVPADSAQVVGGLYDAVRHPIDTVSGVLKVGQGLSDKAVFSIANSISSALGGKTAGPTQDAQMVDAIGKHIKDTYGTAGKFKKAIVENPADTLLTLMGGLGVVKKFAEANNMVNVASNIDKINSVINPVNILKQESRLITKPMGYIGKEVLPQVLGKTTGTSAETIKTAFTQGGTPEFQSALRGETTPQNILSNVQEGMQAIKNDRAIAYGTDYAKLQANKTKLSIDDVAKSFIKSLQDEYKIRVSKSGLDFSQSKITGSTSQSQIENMYKDIVGWKDKTPEGLDVLKQRLQDYYRGTPDSSKGDRLSTIASNAVKQKIVENVPEYANMTATYERLTNDIRDITKTLSLGDKTQAQTAITKLSSVLRENFSARQDMVKLIEQYTGKNIQGQIAGASLNPVVAKGLAGVITGGGIVFGQLANPAFWGGLALASPRLIGEIANTIGIPIEKFKSAINNLKNANTTSNASRSAMEGSTKVKPFTQTPIKQPVATKAKSPITPYTVKEVTPKKIKDPTKTTVNLQQSKGGFIKIPEIGKKVEPLIEEAKKYSKVEDFIKAQGEILYHGTKTEGITQLRPSSGDYGQLKGIYVTPDYNTAAYYGQVNGVQKYAPIKTSIRGNLLNAENMQELKKILGIKDEMFTEEVKDNIKKLVLKKGYDGIRLNRGGEKNEIIVFNPEAIKTESQLKQIYEQANKSIPVKNPLVEEARKYKSAEEFVKSKATLLHGSPKGIVEDFSKGKGLSTTGDINNPTYHFTNDVEKARLFSRQFELDNWNKVKGVPGIKPRSNLPNPGITKAYIDIKNPYIRKQGGDLSSDFVKKLKNEGYDGIVNDYGNGKEYIVFSTSQIKTESQLKDIWNKLNKK